MLWFLFTTRLPHVHEIRDEAAIKSDDNDLCVQPIINYYLSGLICQYAASYTSGNQILPIAAYVKNF